MTHVRSMRSGGVAPVATPSRGAGVRPPAAPAASVDGFERRPAVPTLQRGSTGSAVRALQDRLVKAGLMSLADLSTGPGVYGPRTEAAVRRLQAAVGLPETGVAGPSTQAALSDAGRFVAAAPARAKPPAAEVTARTQPTPIDAHTEEITVSLDLRSVDAHS